MIKVRIQLITHKHLIHFTYVWENANWSSVFLISFVILFKDRYYLGIYQTSWKKKLDRELLKLWCTNRAMTSFFPLMIVTGMPVVSDAFFRLSLFISSKVCSNETKLKLNFELLILEILSLIQIIPEWSSYFWWKLLPCQQINLKFDLQNRGLLE